MVPGVEWCERDGKRYLRADYTVTMDPQQLRTMLREVSDQVILAGPDQNVLAIVGNPHSAAMAELGRGALSTYRDVHLGARTRISVAPLPRSAVVMLRAFHALGGRGLVAGHQDEAAALDWLLSH
jgi:hypothetical protein